MKQIVLLLSLIVMLTACHTVPPTVIGTETRKEISTLKEQAETVNTQAAVIDSSVDTITSDIVDLETKAPEELKPEIREIKQKMTILAGLTETHAVSTQAVEKAAAKVDQSFDEDMKEVAVQGEEKAKAEIQAAKAKGQRNVAWLILTGLAIAAIVVIWLKFKTGILGVAKMFIKF